MGLSAWWLRIRRLTTPIHSWACCKNRLRSKYRTTALLASIETAFIRFMIFSTNEFKLCFGIHHYFIIDERLLKFGLYVGLSTWWLWIRRFAIPIHPVCRSNGPNYRTTALLVLDRNCFIAIHDVFKKSTKFKLFYEIYHFIKDVHLTKWGLCAGLYTWCLLKRSIITPILIVRVVRAD